MGQKELEQVRLTEEERKRFWIKARDRVKSLQDSTEGNFKHEEITAIYDDAEVAMLDAQIAKLIEAGYKKVPELKILSNEEIMSHAVDEVQHTYGWTRDVILEGARVIAQAQLASIERQIREANGNGK